MSPGAAQRLELEPRVVCVGDPVVKVLKDTRRYSSGLFQWTIPGRLHNLGTFLAPWIGKGICSLQQAVSMLKFVLMDVYHILSPFTIVDHRFLLNWFILFLDGGRFGLQGDLLVLGTLGVDKLPTSNRSEIRL